MSRLGRDSTNLDDIPVGTPVVMYYVDGGFAATPAQLARHAGAVLVPITVGNSPALAIVADVETGDYLPWEAPDFVLLRRAQGADPSVYVSFDLWAPTQTEFRLRGVPEPHWWIALWDGVMALIPGSVASQRRNTAYTGAHYDESVVADFWPGVDLAHGGGGGTIPPDDMLTLGLKTGLAHVTIKAIYQREPTPQELADLANAINDDGSNFSDLVQGFASLTTNPDLHAIDSSVLRADVDRALAQGGALAPHHHEGGSTGPAVVG